MEPTHSETVLKVGGYFLHWAFKIKKGPFYNDPFWKY
jgi:hypothetical protein